MNVFHKKRNSFSSLVRLGKGDDKRSCKDSSFKEKRKREVERGKRK